MFQKPQIFYIQFVYDLLLYCLILTAVKYCCFYIRALIYSFFHWMNNVLNVCVFFHVFKQARASDLPVDLIPAVLTLNKVNEVQRQ